MHDSVFYCVANMPGAVPNTSTYALTNATLPYAVALADKGWQQACRDDHSLALGLNTHAGQLTNAPGRARRTAWTRVALEEVLGLSSDRRRQPRRRAGPACARAHLPRPPRSSSAGWRTTR